MPHFHVYYDGEAISCAENEADARIALAEFILRLGAFAAEATALPDGKSFIVQEAGTDSTKLLSWLESTEDDCPERRP
jgi:aromatic ring-cleaving dioxygenase